MDMLCKNKDKKGNLIGETRNLEFKGKVTELCLTLSLELN